MVVSCLEGICIKMVACACLQLSANAKMTPAQRKLFLEMLEQWDEPGESWERPVGMWGTLDDALTFIFAK
jgi:hypothetical protein